LTVDQWIDRPGTELSEKTKDVISLRVDGRVGVINEDVSRKAPFKELAAYGGGGDQE
jgi:hypothetical protein